MATTPDTGQINASNILENLLGVAGSGVDIWQRWQSAKVDNLERKAAIPTTAGNPAQNAVSPAYMPQNMLLIGGVVLALGLGAFLAFGKSAK